MTAAFSSGEAIQYGFSRFGEEPGYCFMLIGAVEALSLVSAAVIAYQTTLLCQLLTQLGSTPPDTFLYAFLVVYFFVRIAGQLVVNQGLLMLHDGRKFTLSDLLGFDFGKHFPAMVRLTAATLVYTVAITVLTFVLVIPAIFAASTLRLFKFVMVDHDAEATEGLRESFEISGQSKGELVSLNLLATAVRIVGIVCLGITFIPASAVCGLAEAYAYRRLTKTHEYELRHNSTQRL